MEMLLAELIMTYQKRIRDCIDVQQYKAKLSLVECVLLKMQLLKYRLSSYQIMLYNNIGVRHHVYETLTKTNAELLELCEGVLNEHVKSMGRLTRSKLTKILKEGLAREIQYYEIFSKIHAML